MLSNSDAGEVTMSADLDLDDDPVDVPALSHKLLLDSTIL